VTKSRVAASVAKLVNHDRGGVPAFRVEELPLEEAAAAVRLHDPLDEAAEARRHAAVQDRDGHLATLDRRLPLALGAAVERRHLERLDLAAHDIALGRERAVGDPGAEALMELAVEVVALEDLVDGHRPASDSA